MENTLNSSLLIGTSSLDLTQLVGVRSLQVVSGENLFDISTLGDSWRARAGGINDSQLTLDGFLDSSQGVMNTLKNALLTASPLWVSVRISGSNILQNQYLVDQYYQEGEVGEPLAYRVEFSLYAVDEGDALVGSSLGGATLSANLGLSFYLSGLTQGLSQTSSSLEVALPPGDYPDLTWSPGESAYSYTGSVTFALEAQRSGPSYLTSSITINSSSVSPTLSYSSRGVRENLLSYSGDYSNPYWTTSSLSFNNSEVIPSATTCYLGFVETLDVSKVHTFSFYAKTGSVDWVYCNAADGVYFNLSGSGSTSWDGYGSTLGARITPIDDGNGWYRCSISFLPSNSSTEIRVYPAQGNGDIVLSTTGSTALLFAYPNLNTGPLIPYVASTGSGAYRSWVGDVGPDLSYVGSGEDIYLIPGPFTDGSPLVVFQGGKYFRAQGTSLASPGTDDIVCEASYHNQSTSGSLVDWANSGRTRRFGVDQQGSMDFIGPSDNSSGVLSSLSSNNLVCVHSFWDNSAISSTGVRSYGNVSTGTDTTLGTDGVDIGIGSSGDFSIGAATDGSSPAQTTFCHVALWASSSWLDTTTQMEDFHQERCLTLMGALPTLASGSKLPYAWTRASKAPIQMIDDGGLVSWTEVGPGWIRLGAHKDIYGSRFLGIHIEGGFATSATQYAKVTDDLSNTGSWTATNTTISSSGYWAPKADWDVWAIKASSTSTAEHTLGQSSTSYPNETWIQFWCKPGLANQVSVKCNSDYCTFTLSGSGSISAGSNFDPNDSLIEYVSDGWYKVIAQYSSSISGDWNIVPTLSGSTSFAAANTGSALVSVLGPAVWDATNYNRHLSYVPNSTTSNSTRSVDNLNYDAASNFDISTNTEFSMDFEFLRNPRDYGGASVTICAYSGYRGFHSSTENAGTFTIATYLGDTSLFRYLYTTDGPLSSMGIPRRIRSRFKNNEQTMIIDDTQQTEYGSDVAWDGTLQGTEVIRIGTQALNGNPLNGLIGKIRIHNAFEWTTDFPTE